jgi:protein AFG1
MPDELAKASGMDFAAPPKGGLMRNLLGFGSRSGRMDMFPSNNEYAAFVEVLKARCEIWNMESGKDWRRREAEEMDTEAAETAEAMREEMIGGFADLQQIITGNPKPDQDTSGLGGVGQVSGSDSATEQLDSSPKQMNVIKRATPKKYVIASSDSEELWRTMIRASLPAGVLEPIPWQSTTLLVYGRKFPVQRHLEGVTYWSFQELCGGTFGSADYITLASTFHTLILDQVTVLTLLQKNEARRLITLLDALYENRCKLLIRADAGPDDLFFPETNAARSESSRPENDGGDAVYPETLSEIYQDQTSPFRPNISSYTNEPRAGYDPDEDSDFGPVPRRGNENGRQVDFGMISSFTGEDERFAFKRARSRLWEMCGLRWYARSEPGWWKPLPLEVRRWERSSSSSPIAAKPSSSAKGDVKLGDSIELDRPAGLQGKELEEREKGIPSTPFR